MTVVLNKRHWWFLVLLLWACGVSTAAADQAAWFGRTPDKWQVDGAQYRAIELAWPDVDLLQPPIAQVMYDFSDLPGTSGIYLQPRDPVSVPANSKLVSMWVYGNASGHWLRGEVRDASGNRYPLDYTASYPQGVTWQGWQFVQAALPSGLEPPLQLTALLRLMALDGTSKGRGMIYVQAPEFADGNLDDRAGSPPDWDPPADEDFWARWEMDYNPGHSEVQELVGTSPAGISAAWGVDPRRSMTVSWWSSTDTAVTEVQHRSLNAAAGNSWQSTAPEAVRTAHLQDEQYRANFHQVTFDALQPGTEYQVRIRQSSQDDWVDLGVMRTLPESSERVTFLYLADSQAAQDFSVYTEILTTARVKFPDLQWVVHGGDLVDQGFSLAQWYRFSEAGSSYDLLPIVATVGNHDVYGQGREWFDLFFPRPKLPFSEQYVYDQSFGPIRLVVLDTETGVVGLREQLSWLQDRSEAWNEPWLLGTFHRAPYRSNPLRGADHLVQTLAGKLEELKFDLVLTAHDHAYMRTYPMAAGLRSSNGTIYLTGGVAGNKFYPGQHREYTEVLFAEPEPVYTVIRAAEQQLFAETWTLSGKRVDHWSLDR